MFKLFSNIRNRRILQVQLSFLHYKLVLNIIQWHLEFYSPNYWHVGPSSSGQGYFGFLLLSFLIIIFLLIFEPDPEFLTQAKLSLKSILPEQELQDQTLCHRQGASWNSIFSHKSVKNLVSKATSECLPIFFPSIYLVPSSYGLIGLTWGAKKMTYAKVQDSEGKRCLWLWALYWILKFWCCLLTRVWKENGKWYSSEPFLRQAVKRGNITAKA